ncbi:protein translocase subunit SecF [Streptosporangium vulgare]|uniref:protein translocase subunit SecF n=1 Tax=Streptosporangium vulgare TaxID=46190 RepID=UPI0031D70EFD
MISIAGLIFNGLNLGVEFKGGSVFSFKAPTANIEQGARHVSPTPARTRSSRRRPRTAGGSPTESLPADQVTKMQRAVSTEFKLPVDQVNLQVIGASWGGQVANKAVIGLIVFMLAIILYLTMAFEWKMALAAVVALLHDLVITAGVYAWSGFEVTPGDPCWGFPDDPRILAVYDAVVVFDMIKEVTAKIGRTSKITYTEAANNALNHTLIRSLNTTLVAILPVAAILFIGTTLFGAGTLKDLSLSLFVGMIVGNLLLAVRRDAAAGHAEGARDALHGDRQAARRARRRFRGQDGAPAGRRRSLQRRRHGRRRGLLRR